MTSFISHTTIDCAHAYELSEWWKPVLGYADLDDDPNEPGHEECMIRDPQTGHLVLFIEVPDAKQGKNRMHFDLMPREGTRDEELARLLEHGATVVLDLRDHGGPAPGGRSSPIPRATSSASSAPRPSGTPPARPAPRPPGSVSTSSADDGEDVPMRWSRLSESNRRPIHYE